MKRCPLCDKSWDISKVFCPWDGHLLKEMNANEMAARSLVLPTDQEENITGLPQYEIFSELSDRKSLEDSWYKFKPGKQSILDVAMDAIDKRKEKDLDDVRDHMKFIERFNMLCRVMQYFTDNLKSQSGSFHFDIQKRDEPNSMKLFFKLSFGEKKYKRVFPITVSYEREPLKEVYLEIDLYQIGHENDSRHFRTEKAGGKVDVSVFGRSYILRAPRDIEGVELLEWLEVSFKKIFKLAYE